MHMAEIFALKNHPPAITLVVKVFFALTSNITLDKINTFIL